MSKHQIYKLALLGYLRLTQFSFILWAYASIVMETPSFNYDGLFMRFLNLTSLLTYIVTPLQQFFVYATPTLVSAGESNVFPLGVYLFIFSVISLIFILILEMMIRIVRIVFDKKQNMLQDLLLPTKQIGYLFVAASAVYFLTMLVQNGMVLYLYAQWYNDPITFDRINYLLSDAVPGFYLFLSILTFGVLHLLKRQIALQEEVDLTI